MMTTRHLIASLALAGTLWIAPVALAQDGGEPTEQNDRGTAFRAVSGPQTEDVPGGPLAAIAYGVAWLLVVGYVWRIGRLQAATAKDLARLQAELGKSES